MDAPARPLRIVGRGRRELTISWSDGRESVLPVLALRKACPCAGCNDLRKQANPLRVLPSGPPGGRSGGPPAGTDPSTLTAEAIELVGNYAIQIRFSDGHEAGIFTFDLLRELSLSL